MFKKTFLMSFALLLSLQVKAQVSTGTLKIAFKSDVQSLDPYSRYDGHTFIFASNIYEPLVERTKDLALEPCLATEWKNIEPSVWRFKLRQGIAFHDGSPLTADDVVFSIERARMETSAIKGGVSMIKSVRKVDAHTVDIITNVPDPILPDEIYGCLIMSKVWCEKHNCAQPSDLAGNKENYADMHANGTGPFMLKLRSPDVKTTLIPHPKWWGKIEHNLKEVEFTPIHSDATRVAALLSGKIDLIGQVPIQDKAKIRTKENFEILETPGLYSLHFGMDQKSPKLRGDQNHDNPLKNLKVRQALAHALDLNSIHEKIMRKSSHPTGLLIGKGIRGYDQALDNPLPYNLKKAKEFLKEAGFEKGFSLNMVCPNDRYINDQMICEATTRMLARVGIKANLATHTKSKFFEILLSGGADFYLLGWWPSTYDVHDVFYNIVASPTGKDQGQYNAGGYSNKKADDLIQKVQKELNLEKRHQFINEVTKIMQDDVSHLPLHQEVVIWAKKKNIHIDQRSDDGLTLKWARFQ
jgi:peptide/nickel transport system substrate-binding protein